MLSTQVWKGQFRKYMPPKQPIGIQTLLHNLASLNTAQPKSEGSILTELISERPNSFQQALIPPWDVGGSGECQLPQVWRLRSCLRPSPNTDSPSSFYLNSGWDRRDPSISHGKTGCWELTYSCVWRGSRLQDFNFGLRTHLGTWRRQPVAWRLLVYN